MLAPLPACPAKSALKGCATRWCTGPAEASPCRAGPSARGPSRVPESRSPDPLGEIRLPAYGSAG